MNNFGISIANYVFGRALSVVARFLVRSNWIRLYADLRRERDAFESKLDADLGLLPDALVVCEDIRFYEHRGVDLYSIARATTRIVLGHSLEGASTLTQQLVRVYTQDYRFSLRRKVKEILLATLVDRHFSKQDQIRLYLCRAYFGWRMNGVTQAKHRLGYSSPYSAEHAAEIAARLKYPEPEFPSPQMQTKIANRAKYILAMLEQGGKHDGYTPSHQI